MLGKALHSVSTSIPEQVAPDSYRISASSARFSTVLAFTIPLAPHHALRLSTEYVRLTSFYVKMNGYKESSDWKFAALPVTLGYEYYLAPDGHRLVPVVGVGVSAYFSRTKQLKSGRTSDYSAKYARSLGFGYGAEASFGVRARLGRSLFLLTQGRYRLVNGFGLYGSNRRGARFPLLDFSVGFGFKL